MEPSKKYTIPSVLLIHYYVIKIQILKKNYFVIFPHYKESELKSNDMTRKLVSHDTPNNLHYYYFLIRFRKF